MWGKYAIIIGDTSVAIKIMGVVALTGNHHDVPEGRDKSKARRWNVNGLCLEEVMTIHL
jgi:hypothetical protein